MICIECENPVVENKELMLCASCNSFRRKSEREQIKSENKIKKLGIGSKLQKNKIKTFSNRNSFKTSTGERFTKAQIENKVKAAKLIKKAKHLEEFGYIFCEDCKTNEGIFDASHELSVDECQKQGTTEYAWDIDNLKIRCRTCHGIKDRNCINYK